MKQLEIQVRVGQLKQISSDMQRDNDSILLYTEKIEEALSTLGLPNSSIREIALLSSSIESRIQILENHLNEFRDDLLA